jgi:hypothetical protein
MRLFKVTQQNLGLFLHLITFIYKELFKKFSEFNQNILVLLKIKHNFKVFQGIIDFIHKIYP